jgi:hypothetical protein
MRYKVLVLLLFTLVLTSAHFAKAHQPTKVPRIGCLSAGFTGEADRRDDSAKCVGAGG